MWGWVGQLAQAFASKGLDGLVLLALLIIIVCLIKQSSDKSKQMVRMHEGMVGALDRSSAAHHGVARVLGRIEGILGISSEDS